MLFPVFPDMFLSGMTLPIYSARSLSSFSVNELRLLTTCQIYCLTNRQTLTLRQMGNLQCSFEQERNVRTYQRQCIVWATSEVRRIEIETLRNALLDLQLSWRPLLWRVHLLRSRKDHHQHTRSQSDEGRTKNKYTNKNSLLTLLPLDLGGDAGVNVEFYG